MTGSLLVRPTSRPREARTRRPAVEAAPVLRQARARKFRLAERPSERRPAPCTPEEAKVEGLLLRLSGYLVRREPVRFDVLDLDGEGRPTQLRGCCPDFEIRDIASGARVFLEVYAARQEDSEPNRRERHKRRRIDFIWQQYGVWVVWIDRAELLAILKRPARLEELIVEAERAQRRRQRGYLDQPRWEGRSAA